MLVLPGPPTFKNGLQSILDLQRWNAGWQQRNDYIFGKKENVEHVPQSSVKALSGNNSLWSITIGDNSGKEKNLQVEGLFIEMGP